MSNYSYIVGGRGTGKTRKLLEYAKEKNVAVVCRSPAAMARKAEAYGIIGLRFISYGELIAANNIYQDDDTQIIEPFVVDEINDFLTELFGGPCIGFTQTEDN